LEWVRSRRWAPPHNPPQNKLNQPHQSKIVGIAFLLFGVGLVAPPSFHLPFSFSFHLHSLKRKAKEIKDIPLLSSLLACLLFGGANGCGQPLTHQRRREEKAASFPPMRHPPQSTTFHSLNSFSKSWLKWKDWFDWWRGALCKLFH